MIFSNRRNWFGGSTFIAVFNRIESLGVEKIRAIYRNSSTIEKQSHCLSFDKLSLFDAIEWVQGDIIDVPTLERI
jgi:hypothetical protein